MTKNAIFKKWFTFIVLVIGGGTGLNSVLKGLKNYTDNITAIVTVSDYGAQKTESRKLLEVLPLDDIKESIVALSEKEEAMERAEVFVGKFDKKAVNDYIALVADKEHEAYKNATNMLNEKCGIKGSSDLDLRVTLYDIFKKVMLR